MRSSVWLRWSLQLRILLVLFLNIILVATLLIVCTFSKDESSFVAASKLPKGKKNSFIFTSQLPYPKDVIVRSAYFDDRPRNGHANATVFMLQVKKDIAQLNTTFVIACGVGKLITTAYSLRPCGGTILNNWIHEHFSKVTYDELMLDCFDLSAQNDSTAFVIYKSDIHSLSARIVESERPFLIPYKHQPHDLQHVYNFKIISCVNIFGPPIWLLEWLQYQKAIGIDHVHITFQNSFLDYQGNGQSYLLQAMKEGFVTVDVWQKQFSDSEIYYHSQTLAYADCIYRYRGTYDYAFMLDTDDFFVPMNPGEKKVHYYVDKWCKESASCAFSWIEYYPDCGLIGEPDIDGNVTRRLNSSVHTRRNFGKSLHKLSVVMDTGVHQAETVVLNTKYFSVKYHHGIVKIPDDEAYVAHLIKNKQPPNIKCY